MVRGNLVVSKCEVNLDREGEVSEGVKITIYCSLTTLLLSPHPTFLENKTSITQSKPQAYAYKQALDQARANTRPPRTLCAISDII